MNNKPAIALIEAGVATLSKSLAVENQNTRWFTSRIVDDEKKIAALQKAIGDACGKRQSCLSAAESLEQQIADLHAAIDTLTQSAILDGTLAK